MKCFRCSGHRVAGLITLVLLCSISALPAAAQAPELTITTASLRLWPEYDDPGLLVIFAGEFAGSATFPQEVAFPLAAGARNIQATVNDPAQGLLTQKWQIKDSTVTYTLPQASFQVEYYVDRQPSGNRREIRHAFEAPYPIKSLEIAVQQPARATDFSVSPQPDSSAVGADGLTYHMLKRENLKAGDKLDIVITYTKTDSGLTSPQLTVPSGTPAAQPVAPASAKATTNWLPWLLIGLGLLAFFGIGAYWLIQQRRAASPAPAPKKIQPRTPPQMVARPTSAVDAAFCTQCGHQLRPGDRFCAQCGAPRKG